MMQFQVAAYNEDTGKLSQILTDHEVYFLEEEEQTLFLDQVFKGIDRFNCDPAGGGIARSDLFTDSDAIVTDMISYLPGRFTCIKDVQDCSWWEFCIYLPNVKGAFTSRVEIRSTKPTKGKSLDAEYNTQLRASKNSIAISERLLKRLEVSK